MRRLLLAVLALAVLVAGALAFSIDRLARTAIERDASRALGVDVSLRFIHLRPIAGALHVSHLAIANPPGFEGAHFFALRKLDLGLELRSLRSDIVRVPRFAVVGVDVSLERRGRESNSAAILANLKRFESAGAAPREPAAHAPEKRFRVARLVIRDITAKVGWNDLASRASALDVKLDSIELSDPGGARGLTLSELSNVVVKAVLDGLRTSGQLPVEVALDLTGGLRGLAQLPITVTGGVLEGAGGLVGGKPGAALDAAGGAVRAAGAAVERGVEGVFERARREPER